MTRIKILLILFVASLSPFSFGAKDPEQVSFVQLLANPDKYEGKRIAVAGFLRMEFEGNAIYMHQHDFENQIYKNGFWVSSNSDVSDKLYDSRDGYVMIVGKFTTKTKGHLGLWSGSIDKIDRVILLPLKRNR